MTAKNLPIALKRVVENFCQDAVVVCNDKLLKYTE